MSCRMILRKNKHAYTLVEVLMGVFILSIGVVSILGAFPLGMKIVYRIKRTTMLCTFAASKAAELRAYANPAGTLCSGENLAATTAADVEVNPFVAIAPDSAHKVPGVEGDRADSDSTYDYGIKGTHSKQPTGSNGYLRIFGGGRNLHWKVSDFDLYIRSNTYKTRDMGSTVYPGIDTMHSPKLTNGYYDRILDTTYRMGLTQNERRYSQAYGFTRRYVIEVFESPQNVAKTDKDYDPDNPVKYSAYYVFSTGVWNPHVFHSTEWSPVVQNNAKGAGWADAYGEGMDPATGVMTDRYAHDYFWKWANEVEGWGFEKSKTMRYVKQNAADGDADLIIPDLDKKLDPGSGPFPWI